MLSKIVAFRPNGSLIRLGSWPRNGVIYAINRTMYKTIKISG